MGSVAEIGHLIAHAFREEEGSTVFQFREEFACEYEEHVAAVTPMVSQVSRCVLDHSHPHIARVERALESCTCLTRMLGRRYVVPGSNGKRLVRNFHGCAAIINSVKEQDRSRLRSL
jgi:hypothetical protein